MLSLLLYTFPCIIDSNNTMIENEQDYHNIDNRKNHEIYYILDNKLWSFNLYNFDIIKIDDLSTFSSSKNIKDDEYILCEGNYENNNNNLLYIISVNKNELIVYDLILRSQIKKTEYLDVSLKYYHKNGACIIKNNMLYIMSKNKRVSSRLINNYLSSSICIQKIKLINLFRKENINKDKIKYDTCFQNNYLNNNINNNKNIKPFTTNLINHIYIIDNLYIYKLYYDDNQQFNLCLFEHEMIANTQNSINQMHKKNIQQCI